jgi:hypothetical protein
VDQPQQLAFVADVGDELIEEEFRRSHRRMTLPVVHHAMSSHCHSPAVSFSGRACPPCGAGIDAATPGE